MDPPPDRGPHRAFRAAMRGQLPVRYDEHLPTQFRVRVRPALRQDVQVLDFGAGQRPAIPLSERPRGCHYVALDVSRDELERAPAGAYDEIFVADAAEPVTALEERFDLIVSWNVLEHARPLDAVLANLHSYLRPGGRLVAQFAGAFSAHALLSRVTPHQVAARAMERLLGREPETVFAARYDRCYYSALERLLMRFRSREIVTHYRDASYFRFARLAQAVYLMYEEWAFRDNHRNLASHYLICAER